jgi:hypothetical protein
MAEPGEFEPLVALGDGRLENNNFGAEVPVV